MLASVSQFPSEGGLKRRGRVPSFYTSRSLVNLSGLSGEWRRQAELREEEIEPSLHVFIPRIFQTWGPSCEYVG